MVNGKIPAVSFVKMLSTMVNNEHITDDAFRAMVSGSISGVEGCTDIVLNTSKLGSVRTFKEVETEEKAEN